MIKKIIIICLLSLNNYLIPKHKVIIISIPKAGTHLLEKCIQLILNNSIPFKFYYDLDNEKLKQDDLFKTHLKFCRYNNDITKNLKRFFVYRDPRDQLISYIFWTYKEANNPETKDYFNSIFKDRLKFLGHGTNYLMYKNTPINNFINILINSGTHIYDGQGGRKYYESTTKRQETQGIATFYKSYLSWIKQKNICCIKFENLIGPLGKGNSDLQIKEIKKIANYLEIKITEQKAKEIAKLLFGNSKTFRNGQIGSWKKYFNQYHKTEFKKSAGKLLIQLRYENDFNW